MASTGMMIVMNRILRIALFAAALGLAACGTSNETRVDHSADADTPAGKVGKAAHGIAKETGKVAREAGRELKKAAGQAHEGWKEADREDKAKKAK